MQSANQQDKDWKQNFFGCLTKSAASHKQFEFDFFLLCLHAISYHWMKFGGYLLRITSDLTHAL